MQPCLTPQTPFFSFSAPPPPCAQREKSKIHREETFGRMNAMNLNEYVSRVCVCVCQYREGWIAAA